MSEIADLRKDMPTLQAILNRIVENRVKSVAMLEQVFGCPHEEGIDYPDGQWCPRCPFWKNRDRLTRDYLP